MTSTEYFDEECEEICIKFSKYILPEDILQYMRKNIDQAASIDINKHIGDYTEIESDIHFSDIKGKLRDMRYSYSENTNITELYLWDWNNASDILDDIEKYFSN